MFFLSPPYNVRGWIFLSLTKISFFTTITTCTTCFSCHLQTWLASELFWRIPDFSFFTFHTKLRQDFLDDHRIEIFYHLYKVFGMFFLPSPHKVYGWISLLLTGFSFPTPLLCSRHIFSVTSIHGSWQDFMVVHRIFCFTVHRRFTSGFSCRQSYLDFHSPS